MNTWIKVTAVHTTQNEQKRSLPLASMITSSRYLLISLSTLLRFGADCSNPSGDPFLFLSLLATFLATFLTLSIILSTQWINMSIKESAAHFSK